MWRSGFRRRFDSSKSGSSPSEPLDEEPGPDPSFTLSFEGPISLADGRLVVGDIMGVTRFVSLIGEASRRQIRVAVDEPGWNAAAIDIFVGPRL
jgi:hypothetical protein